MWMDPSGRPWVVTSALATLVAYAFDWTVVALGCGLASLVFAWFFRDPQRRPPSGTGLVLAPADGRVILAGAADERAAPPGRWLQVSIFLSPLDVHVNRTPVEGRVARVDQLGGAKRPAYEPEASYGNARTEIWFDTDAGPVVCRQVAGLLARRVVCRLAPGRLVRAGERFGIIKFGSRVDLFLPACAVLCVAVGARVRAGETILARLVPPVGACADRLDDPTPAGNNRA